jgi:hypothetical protein
LRELQAEGLEPVLEILQWDNGLSTWQDAEMQAIARHQPDLNVLRGGQCARIPSESRKRAGEKLRGRTLSPEHRKKISEAKQGTKRPDMATVNRKIAVRNVGRKMNLSDEERARRSAWMKKLGRPKLTTEQEAARRERISLATRDQWRFGNAAG